MLPLAERSWKHASAGHGAVATVASTVPDRPSVHANVDVTSRRELNKQPQLMPHTAFGTPRGLDPITRALLGIGVPINVGHYRRAIRSGFECSSGALQGDTPNPNEGYLAYFLLPFRNARKTLRREGHGFQDRGIDRPKRDIIRACSESTR